MSNDLHSETAVCLKAAREHFTGRPHPTTVRRWCSKGVRSSNGKQAKLETYREGYRVYTTLEAIARFRRKVNGFDDADG